MVGKQGLIYVRIAWKAGNLSCKFDVKIGLFLE